MNRKRAQVRKLVPTYGDQSQRGPERSVGDKIVNAEARATLCDGEELVCERMQDRHRERERDRHKEYDIFKEATITK